MSNHYHLVLRINQAQALKWSEQEIMRRWGTLFKLPLIVARYQKQETQTQAEQREARRLIAQWRERLMDLSWYMRCLNEYLARHANEEDHCTGRFWPLQRIPALAAFMHPCISEGRFKSQALLDDAAVLTCMSYVDLNPIRAGIATTPEASDFTSIQQRIRQLKGSVKQEKNTAAKLVQVPLMRLSNRSASHPQAVAFTTKDYLELVDWAGRAIRDDKKGSISNELPSILERLGIAPNVYLAHVRDKRTQAIILGKAHNIRKVLKRVKGKFIKGIGLSRRLFPLLSG